MRVSKTTTTSTGTVPKRPAGGSGGSAFKVETGPSAPSVRGAGGASAAAPIGAFLALQEVDDPTKGRKKAINRANNMLDLLEEIRLDLLAGTLPNARLANLLTLVKGQRDQVHDPRGRRRHCWGQQHLAGCSPPRAPK